MDRQQHEAVVRSSMAQAQDKLRKARQREGGPSLVQLAEARRLLDLAVEHQDLIDQMDRASEPS